MLTFVDGDGLFENDMLFRNHVAEQRADTEGNVCACVCVSAIGVKKKKKKR